MGQSDRDIRACGPQSRWVAPGGGFRVSERRGVLWYLPNLTRSTLKLRTIASAVNIQEVVADHTEDYVEKPSMSCQETRKELLV
jgi:hypothetical protein